jgi:hypothetical protein
LISKETIVNLSDYHSLIESQHQQLCKLLADEPVLSELQFQGKTLAEISTPAGLNSMKLAASTQTYDKVALNHGIGRLRLDGYSEEIIWDYHGTAPAIIENDEITYTLESNAEHIIAEVLACTNETTKFPDSDSLTNPNGLWSFRSFFEKSGLPNQKIQSICPKTTKIIEALNPNLTFGFAFISVLDPNTTIAAHRGSTSLRQRYHLGIKIPSIGTSRIRIGSTWKNWSEGKAFGFNDSLEHEVEHWSDEHRVVLILDTWAAHIPLAVVDAIRRNPKVLQLGVMFRESDSTALND